MSDKLKPCPFCGGEHVRCRWNYMGDGFKYREIHCNNCSATLTKYSEYVEDDIELCILWNTRAETNAITSETNGITRETSVIGQPVESSETDSRERLEADVRGICWGHAFHRYDAQKRYLDERGLDVREDIVTTNYDGHVLATVIIHMLDRQDAITRREVLHSNPMCGGRDVCHATNLPDSESVERETPNTTGIGALKDEIRDFDVWSVAYEIYCAGGYVDNGSEPNPPTKGIYELLDRQAAITSSEWCYSHDALEEELERVRAERDELKAEIAKYEHDCGLLFDEKNKLTAERDKLLAELEEYSDFEKAEFAIPLDEAMKFTTDPPGYVKKHIAEIQAERDDLRRRNAELEAEVEAQRKRANDAERGVLSEEWYVSRDRYEDDITELTAERDELQSIIDHMPKTEAECEACQEAHDCLMFNAKVHQDELRDELKHKQLVIDTQRDSFLKLEAENAELRKMLADAAEAI